MHVCSCFCVGVSGRNLISVTFRSFGRGVSIRFLRCAGGGESVNPDGRPRGRIRSRSEFGVRSMCIWLSGELSGRGCPVDGFVVMRGGWGKNE